MRTKTINLYAYDELSEEAQKKARAYFRTLSEGDDFFSEWIIEDFAKVAFFCGWDINKRPIKLMNGETRMEPSVYWSLGNGGASFNGSWRAEDVSLTLLRKHAPRDTELLRIGREFTKIKRSAPHASASATASQRGNYHNMAIEVEDIGSDRTYNARTDALIEATTDLAHWLYLALDREHKYRNSDEQVAENIRANEYEFTDNGDWT